MYLGSRKIDDTLVFCCNTHTPSTGAETDADDAPTYRVYEDETTEPILTGSMAKLDDDNTTGFYSEQITLSAANGFEKGKSYNVRVTGIVGGVTGSVVYTFQIEAEVDANVVSDSRMANLDAAVSGRSTFNPASDEVDIGKVKGVAVTSADDFKANTSALALEATVGALNDLSAAEVNAEVDTALGDYDPPTKTEMDTAFTEIKGSGWSTETLKAIQDAIADIDTGALTSSDLDGFVSRIAGLFAQDNKTRTLNTSVDEIVSDIELGLISGSIKNFYPGVSKTIGITIKENGTNVTFADGDVVTLMLKTQKSDADEDAELTVTGVKASGRAVFGIVPSDTTDISAGDYFMVAKYVSGSNIYVVYDGPVKLLTKVTDAAD